MAVRATGAGLPVVPGAWWSPVDRQFHCDQPGCHRTGPHPAVGGVERPGLGAALSAHAIRQPEEAAARWREQPYAVLIPTGEACDVVDVPTALGQNLAAWLDARSSLGPLIAAGSRWFFLTAAGGQLSPFGGDIVVHGHGSWIMLPPSLGPGGEPATWLVEPAMPGRTGWWNLPARDEVIRGLNLPLLPVPRHPSRPGRSDDPGRQVRPSPV